MTLDAPLDPSDQEIVVRPGSRVLVIDDAERVLLF
jgi:hypothetical protein